MEHHYISINNGGGQVLFYVPVGVPGGGGVGQEGRDGVPQPQAPPLQLLQAPR